MEDFLLIIKVQLQTFGQAIFYLLIFQATLHQISENLDGGDIFFQTSSRIRKKDNINDLSMQNSKNFTLLFEKKFKSRKFFKVKKGIKQEKEYGIWKKSHLTKIIFH